jgi:lipoprotein-anchoring transpeptidase ErfK/SrfK
MWERTAEMPKGQRGRAGVAVLAGLLMFTIACAGGGNEPDGAQASDGRGPATTSTTDTTAPATAAAPVEEASAAVDLTYVAVADVDRVDVFAEPGGEGTPVHQLDNPTKNGAPLVFTVVGDEADGPWLEVNLPVRPNGSTGFVRSSDVTVNTTDYRLKVALAAHTLTVTKGGEVVLETPIGVGTSETPTPDGVYYLAALLQPPNPAGAYGPYAYGLSGFSNNPELANFNGGDGIIGIHGTDEPDRIGSDVSHGCIRVTNEVITDMAGHLPLGTPVEILA